MTLRFASFSPDEFSHVSARLLRRTLALAVLTAATPVWADAPAQAASSPAAEAPGTLTVKSGQSLNDLAVELTQSHDPAVLARASQALFQANPRAFMKHDPSLLMVGATLQVPAGAAAGSAVAASGAASAAAASSPAAGSIAASQAASPVPVSTAAGAAGASTVVQPVSGVATASGTAGAGMAADNASAGVAASAPTPASVNPAASESGAVPAASTALVDAKPGPDGVTKAWGNLGGDGRTRVWAVAAVVAAVLLLLVGLAWRRRRRARARSTVKPTAATSLIAGSEVSPVSATVAPTVSATAVPDAALEVPARSAAAMALARAMVKEPEAATEVGGESPAVSAGEPLANGDAPEPTKAEAPGTLTAAPVPAHAAAPDIVPQPLHTIPLDAIAALDGLGMSLPPRVSTDSIEPAPSAAYDADDLDILAPQASPVGGLGSLPLGVPEQNFKLEHPASAAGAAQAPSPEVLARIARNKLDLAHEYVNLGDFAGARVLAQEVIDAGQADAREAAQALLARLNERS